MEPVTLGLIVGNRGFFPDHLCETGRTDTLNALQESGCNVICLDPAETPFGSVESLEDARKCAALFKAHAEQIDRLLVTLPNFGDEKAVANAVRECGLRVPILVHAFPDEPGKMTVKNRRDSFCGKISVCNNLRQYDLPFSLTRQHSVDPGDSSFKQDLSDFAATCRVVRGLRRLRVGALGARPTAFNTVRYSEKLLERHGIAVETLDLYEALGRAERLGDDAEPVKAKREAITAYVNTDAVPAAAITKMARLAAVIDAWMAEQQLDATAVQCWTALEEFFGVVPCTVMSMMSNALQSSACEVDVMGAVAMHALAQASGRPSALVDWNNNYGDDPNQAVVFHCSNLPKDVFVSAGSDVKMEYQTIIAGAVGQENSYGSLPGRIAAGQFTYLRLSTDDTAGVIRAYTGQGELRDHPLDTFGGCGVVEIPDFQRLLRYICENGFEHHVAINLSSTVAAVNEALDKYLKWDVYVHQ